MANVDEFAWIMQVALIEEAAAQVRTTERRIPTSVDAFSVSENEFKKHFRVSKDTAQNLVSMLTPFLSEPSTSFYISAQRKVLAALNFFGSGSYQTPVGNNVLIGLSQTSVSRAVEEVCRALNEPAIFNEWVKFPSTFEEFNSIASKFYRYYGFPGIIGCVDCTHVAIVPPSCIQYNEKSFVNRKNYHSINTQLICDADMKILNVNSRFPGSSHDSHIWNNSRVSTFLQNLFERGHTDYHLIGDSGYPLRPWLLIPFEETSQGTPEYAYNKALRKARSTIERCNGTLKARFRCLLKHRTLHYNPEKASKLINACSVLHNICTANNDSLFDFEDVSSQELGYIDSSNIPNPPRNIRTNRLLYLGRTKRDNIVRNYF